MTEQQYDKKDLKILALRERVAQLTAEYEDKIADLRVELTVTTQEFEAFKKSLESAEEGEKSDGALPDPHDAGYPHNVG
jgi:hypothetical protein